jgi:histidinol dehydrogenase
MITFRDFTNICEGKKSALPPNAVPGTYQEKDGVKSYTLAPYEGPSKPIGSAKKVKKILDKQGGVGGKSVKKYARKIEKIKEDIEQRRQQLRQRQLQQMQANKQKVADYQASQRERQSAAKERESLKREIKRELQSEMKAIISR